MTFRVDWRPFGDLAEFRNGVNFSASSRSAGDLTVIGVGDFKANHRLTDFSQLERIARPKTLGDGALLKDGDLVFVRSNGNRGLIGRCMLLKGVDRPVTHSGFTIRARLTSSEVSPEWIAQYFATGLAKRAIMRRGGGTNISNLSQQILQDLSIPLPKLAYQRQVLAVADGYSETLRLLDAGLMAKRTFKRGLMQQLLTGWKRFAEFQDRPWHSSPLDKHVTQVTRRNLSGLELVLTASGEQGLVDQRRYFHRGVAGADLTKYYLLRKGEFAYNRSAMIGYPFGATKRLDRYEAGALSTLYLCFAINDPKVDSDYLKHVFESGVLNRQLRPIARVGARAHGLLNVSDDDFLSISISLPELDEQRRIAEILNTADRELDLLTARRELIQREKRGRLSKLLSGGIAVPS